MIDLYQTGAYCRTAGGNLQRPLDQKQAVSWMSWSINPDNGLGGDPHAWDTCLPLWEQHGILHFPWLHCHSLGDIHRLITVAEQHNSPAIGLNLEDIHNEFILKGVSDQDIAQTVSRWQGPIHLATLPWVQNSVEWGLFARAVVALEIFPDEQQNVFPNGYDANIVNDCIWHAFDMGLTKVTLMFKTLRPVYSPAYFENHFRICHSLYTADDIEPSQSGWASWVLAGPCEKLKPPMPPDPWYKKPYPKGSPVGPAELPRRLYPQDAIEKGRTPSPPGPDVLAFKRAIIRAQRWDRELSEIDDVYYNRFSHGEGTGTVANSGVAGFQRQEGIQDTGWIGDGTYQKIRRSLVPIGPNQGKPLLDAKAVALLKEAVLEVGQSSKMLTFYKWLDWLARHEPQVLYSQARPIQPLVAKENPPDLPSALDCSGSLIYVSWLADLPSPDPSGYTGLGNTDSLKMRGTRVDPARARSLAKGQRVFAFYNDPDHVVAVLPGGEVWSHGRESGPELRNEGIHYRSNFSECRSYPS